MSQKEMHILWLSDIHFKAIYCDEGKVTELIADFIKTVSHENEKKEITHVVFTGDIAFSASEPDDYVAFKETLLSKITAVCINSVYLFVPGNHDVEWEKLSSLYVEAKGKGKSLKEFFKYHEKVNLEQYSKIFSVFSSYRFSRFPDVIKSQPDNFQMDKSRLSGFFYHEDFNCLFLLINSAYLSYGQIPGKNAQDEFKVKLLEFGYRNVLSQVIEGKDGLLSEYGNQTYALHAFDKHAARVERIIADKKPLVISLAHHPPEWLHWTERHSDDGDLNAPLDKFLFRHSSLFLVGHEHSAPSTGSRHGEHCLMLRAGMFLDSSVESQEEKRKTDKEYFPCNWFSLLEIDAGKITHRRFNYFVENYAFSWKEKPAIRYKNDSSAGVPASFLPWKQDCSPKEIDKWEIVPTKFNCNQFKHIEFFQKNHLISMSELDEKYNHLLDTKQLDYRIYSYPDVSAMNVIRVVLTNRRNLYDFSTREKSGFKAMLKLFGLLVDMKVLDHESTLIVSIFDFFRILPVHFDLEKPGVRAAIGDEIVKNEAKYNVFKHHFFDLMKHDPLFKTLHEMKFTYHFLNADKYAEFITVKCN
ncbi:MAG: metallophosphoesterase [Bacteroidetes bacterium]|nr:metallophosphoesterase [Bacteroidota bacterium]